MILFKKRIFTSIFNDSSNFLIWFLNISFIFSIVSKSLFNERSLSEVVDVEIDDDDDEQGGGAVKTFEAKIKFRIMWKIYK